MRDDEVLDDLIRRNKLLIAAAGHVRGDTLWVLHLVRIARVRAQASAELRAIVERTARRRRCSR